MTAAEAKLARLRSCVGDERSSLIHVDEQVALAVTLLERARRYRDLTAVAGRADLPTPFRRLH